MGEGVFERYKIKDEYKTLFENLASGDELTPKAAFNVRKPDLPQPKSYDSEDEFNQKHAILRKLVDAGFVEVLGENVKWKDR